MLHAYPSTSEAGSDPYAGAVWIDMVGAGEAGRFANAFMPRPALAPTSRARL